ncbi:MAG: bifunctional UDP-sugar hydrolase/5'-nucleotidase [Spirochaetes bacterium]|nr:bifunctional UDP-sugar hydrolase/5'-nucleotidase [Spirochaetota bacterium]
MMRLPRIALSAVLIALYAPAFSQEKLFTIVHTNDMHSHLEGFAPELDYTPRTTGDDATLGGWARIATAIRDVKAERGNPVLVLDAGDFLMGSLFHMVSRERGVELRLLKKMGYDAVGLGNHEFDLKPDGLARILAAANAGGMPLALLSNAVFSAESAEDDSLEKAFSDGLVKPYTVMVSNGVKIGIFALMGKEAAEVAPFSSPVDFRPPAEAAKEMVKVLRETEKVDMVICISHSGLWADPKVSEDVLLAQEVPGIDVIVSGHTHTKLDIPLVVNGTIIVQAWEHGKQVGVLDFAWKDGKAALRKYTTVKVNDAIPGNPAVQKEIDSAIAAVDRDVLAAHGLRYWEILAETDVDMRSPLAESGIGNMVTDSIRWYVDKVDSDPADPASRVAFVVESNGVLRDELAKGKTGRISVADLFRVVPLGVGMDDTMAYPIITVYLTGAEIKKTLEVLTSVYPMKGSDYFLQVSGVKFTYNPRRMLFDRITGIWMGSEELGYKPLDYSKRNATLYRTAANMYNSTFLKLIGGFTYGILTIVPKDRDGKPIADLATARVDADKSAPGIQELKEWAGLMEYVRQFPDVNGNGIPDIPAKYKAPLGRNVAAPSWNPVSLLSHGTFVTWIVVGVVLFVLLLVAGLVVLVVRLATRGRRKSGQMRP